VPVRNAQQIVLLVSRPRQLAPGTEEIAQVWGINVSRSFPAVLADRSLRKARSNTAGPCLPHAVARVPTAVQIAGVAYLVIAARAHEVAIAGHRPARTRLPGSGFVRFLPFKTERFY